MDKIIKIILAVLFFLCLLDMPYGYYMFVRFAGMTGFAILAYQSFEKGYHNEMIMYICLALLFQPFLKVALGKPIWNMVDVVVGIGLCISIYIKPQRKSQ